MAKRTHETTVFRSGNSDAVRLPRGFAAPGQKVRVRRLPGGKTLIEPVRPRGWSKGFLASFGRVTRDFAAPPRPRPDATSESRAGRLFEED